MTENPSWYQDRPEPEETYRGRLRERVPVISPGGRTRLLYELDIEAASPLAIYAPDIERTLRNLRGQQVTLVGKVVDLSDEGFGREFWLGPHSVRDVE